jgi:hypothetical protein
MSLVKDPIVRFRQSTSADVVSNRIRVRPANTGAAYDAPFQDFPKPAPGTDGYSRIPVSSITAMTGVEGRRDIHITALDSVGNESDFLEIDNQLFDVAPPAAPTDGSVV